MRFWSLLLAVFLACFCRIGTARADVGWSEEQYTKQYGQGERGFAKVNERGYLIGGNHLVVEFNADSTQSIGELWALGAVRDDIPAKVAKAGELAAKGPLVETVNFKAKSALPAEIHEAVVDGDVVRVDIRNNLMIRIAICGPKPSCGLWQRIFGPPCDAKLSCGVLDRALTIDRTMDELHERAEEAVQRMGHQGG